MVTATRLSPGATFVFLDTSGARGRDHVRTTWSGTAELRIGAGTQRQVVDAILTGMHEEDASHFVLLEAFASRARLRSAVALVEGGGFRGHEFGDAMLVL
jgi:S-adenosylmethionine:tRNA ribosyltransferase-isomerase